MALMERDRQRECGNRKNRVLLFVLEVERPEGVVSAGAGAGVEVGAEVEASESPQALALRDLGNVMVGSTGFQQFFLM